MLLDRLSRPWATLVRVVGLGLVSLSVIRAGHHLGGSGRELVSSISFAACVVSSLLWTARAGRERERGITPSVLVMAAAGGVLTGASPDSAASAFVFAAVVSAGIRGELDRAGIVVAVGALGLAVATLIYDGGALGLLAYALGFVAAALAASNSRQSIMRADQAELLLAQTQRSHEEQLRAARLEESTRIAREIHDVLAHALAALAIQLEATSALIEHGADRDAVLTRIKRAHELAREGLQETRRAVGALRGDPISAPAGIEALVAEYGSATDANAELTIDGDPARFGGPVGEAVFRVVQEALTNVRKHAPGADVSVVLHAGARPDEELVLTIDDRPVVGALAHESSLAATGGGYGLQGMRERAQMLGGTLQAGAGDGGWRVELRLPPPPAEDAK
jgi:signal transduction histidine kinase